MLWSRVRKGKKKEAVNFLNEAFINHYFYVLAKTSKWPKDLEIFLEYTEEYSEIAESGLDIRYLKIYAKNIYYTYRMRISCTYVEKMHN